MNLKLVLWVDYDPWETYWTLEDSNNVIVDNRPESYYSIRCRRYEETIAITDAGEYTFTIKDSFGDGMSKICPGNYTMMDADINTALFAGSGKSFTNSKSHTINVIETSVSSANPSSAPTLVVSTVFPSLSPTADKPSSVPSFSPTVVLSDKPSSPPTIIPKSSTDKPSQTLSSAPSSKPTPTPTSLPKQPRRIPHTLVIHFDKNPEEVQWKIVDDTNTESTIHGELYGHYQTPCITDKIGFDLIEGVSYTFTIYDQQGNGMKNSCTTGTTRSTGGTGFTPGYEFYEGKIDNVQSLIFKGGGDSYTMESTSFVAEFNAQRTPSPTAMPMISEIGPSPLSAGSILAIAIGGIFFLIFGLCVYKMCSMRQKGRPVYAELNRELS